MTYRTTGVATYRNYDFFGLIEGLNFAAQYQGKNERTDNGHLYGADYTRANGDGFGISSTYVYDGFGIGAVYTKLIGQMRRKEPLLILSMPPVRMQNCGLQV